MTDTQLKKIQLQSGFNKNTTTYNAENWWVDGDKVRFRNGRAEKIGGFVKEVVEQSENSLNTKYTGVARDIHTWTDLSFNKYIAVGTHKKVEQYFGGQVFDITPYREVKTLTDVLSAVDTESEITITDTNHNTEEGDYIYVDSQASSVGGLTLAGSYTVSEVVDVDNFKVDTGTAATSTESLAGGLVEYNYLLENGSADNGNVTGYGGGTWDTPGLAGGGYDKPRAGTGGTYLRQWSLDNWGEDLIACVRGGKVYDWDATSGLSERLQPLTDAPEQNYLALVAQPSRHLVVFGTVPTGETELEPLTVRWASQESRIDWEVTSTNTAGEYRLPLGNYILTAIQTKSEIIIFTDTNVYSMRYVGGSEVFQFDIIANNVTATSQHCGVDSNGIVYWMGVDNFYMYDGVVKPLSSTLDEFIFDQDSEGLLNFQQKEKVFCTTNNEFNEVMWLYPSADSLEIDRYVIYNYVEGVWYDGSYDRTVWLDRSIFEKPYAISSEGVMYAHEEGKDADGTALEAFVRSGDIDLEDGENIVFMDKFVPDFKLFPNRNAQLTLYLKEWPHLSPTVKGPYSFNNDTGKINLRARGRHMSIEYRVNTTGADFEVGAPRFGIQPDGER